MIDPTIDARPLSSDGGPAIVVLLVDDQPFVGAALSLLVKSEPDIELHCCLWADNAIALANQIGPSLVLQDLVIPNIDGLGLIRAFRANPQTSTTPVIVLSGSNDDPNLRARAIAAGANGYLVKPPPKGELIACIRQHAARSAGESATLDPAVLDGLRDAPDFMRHLIDQFIDEACAGVHALKEAAAREDAHALHALAHTLRGSSMVMGASRLAALCAQVESQAAGAPGGKGAAARMADIDQELVRVRYALAAQKAEIGQA